MRIKEKVEAVKAIPGQIRMAMIIAISALIVAIFALGMSAVHHAR
jgi:hypothetical protein